tara:strand:- start:144 stop:551 length:408 start_codon:yes stop_codon:yes gene_type:complete
MYITRRERFSAAHRLVNSKFNEEKNKNTFDKCYKLHGHNYELFVTVTGEINPDSGFIIDLKDLKNIIREKVLLKLDHNYINEVDFMKNTITSTENLCVKIWQEIAIPIQKLGAILYKIKITETENNTFEYFGPNK